MVVPDEMALRMSIRLGLIRILSSVFPMIALFDPGHLPMKGGHRTLLWPYNSVMVQFWRYKFAQVV